MYHWHAGTHSICPTGSSVSAHTSRKEKRWTAGWPETSRLCAGRRGLPDLEGGFAGLPVHAAARDFESLPAELPSHVVDRLLRQDPPGSAAPVPMDSIKVGPPVSALVVACGLRQHCPRPREQHQGMPPCPPPPLTCMLMHTSRGSWASMLPSWQRCTRPHGQGTVCPRVSAHFVGG